MQAERTEQFAAAAELIMEYTNALPWAECLVGLKQEIADLSRMYGPPKGRLLVGYENGKPAGIVGLRDLGDGNAEMKRLYVRPAFRRGGLGRELVERLIAEARTLGYRAVRLETVDPHMAAAIALYRSPGFTEIAPYHEDDGGHTLYMELELELG